MTMSIRIDVRDELGAPLDALEAVLGLADDLDVVEQLEVAAEAPPDDAVVVDEQDPDRRAGPAASPRRLDRPCSSSAASRLLRRRPSSRIALSRARPTGRPPARCVSPAGAPRWSRIAAARIATPPATWIGVSASSRSSAARVTPTSGSNSIRIPARVPPIARMPMRNRIDGMPAAKIPVKADDREGAAARANDDAERSAGGDRRDRAGHGGGAERPSPWPARPGRS